MTANYFHCACVRFIENHARRYCMLEQEGHVRKKMDGGFGGKF